MLRTLRVLEISLIVAAILGIVAVVFPDLRGRWFAGCESALSRFAESRGRVVAALFVLVIVARVLALPFLHVPVPGIHDEFSYLLMGDTFAHGRLANPTHPMWISFETFHVNWHPAYASMYPPAQGLALVVGEVLGNPWIGVLLSCAAMCAAITWMLQGWLPARWALLGGAMVALKLGVASYWVNSYWGGAAAAIGGALALGAMTRISRRARVRDALWLGLGIAILANSRPYEGFLFCAPVAMWFVWWLAGKTKSREAAGARFWRVAAPLAVMVALTVVWMGYYNFRLTGNALLMPHVLNTRTYHSAQPFLWQTPLPALHYRNQQFEDFYNEWERENYHRGATDALRVTWEKIFRGGVNYFWMGLLLALPGVPYALRDRKMRFPIVVLAIVIAGVSVVVWSAAHYAAPITCVLFLLIVQAVRHLRTMRWRGRPVGMALSRALVICLVLDACIYVARGVCDPLFWPCEGDPSRAAIAKKLEHTPGKHLIVVRYTDDHNIHDDWVYNGAEIDGAKVLWARELDEEQNAKLLAYFKDRKIWLVTPDTDNTYLAPYTPDQTGKNDSDKDDQ
ncbi:MAG TPA: hypothetical protein VMP12_09775 [Candidatus Sulfotelmatobacter sp.]|nr:hypothetical protein [Candidatus Sulfotelmatobacter sp.]